MTEPESLGDILKRVLPEIEKRVGIKQFTFYWDGGTREVFEGISASDALNKAGYGHGSIKALDFYMPGDNQEYTYNKVTHQWKKIKEQS
jgi:hypothetical protein